MPSTRDAASPAARTPRRSRALAWGVLALWALVLAVALLVAPRLGEVQDNDSSNWLPAGAESAEGLELVRQVQGDQALPTLVVYHRDGGLEPSDLATVGEQAQQLAEVDGVVPVAEGGPPVLAPASVAAGQKQGLVSDDGEVAIVVLALDLGSEDEQEERLPTVVGELRDVTGLEGGEVHLAGPGGQAADAEEAFGGIDAQLLLVALGVVVVLLLLTYRSPVLWLLPIVCAVVALMCAEAIIYLLARYADLTVTAQSTAILSVLVIGAGTDYALLLVARYREELTREHDRHRAMAVAVRRAAPAITASAATVAAGMVCLLVAELRSTAGLGPVAAVGVVVTLVVMLTLLPALLVCCGRWIFWPRRPTVAAEGEADARPGGWDRLGSAIARRPRAVWVGTSLALAAACLGLLTLQTGSVSAGEQYTREMDAAAGERLLREHGIADTSTPVQVVAPDAELPAVVTALEGVDGLGEVRPAGPSRDGLVVVEAEQRADPSSAAAADQVRAARAALDEVPDALVTGEAATTLDTAEASARDDVRIIPLVLLVVTVVLMVLLRAIAAPLLLIATVVLSFGAALGLSALVFEGLARVLEYGAGFERVEWSVPLYAFVFLVALGIDYNIFLMTRVREEATRAGTHRGALAALASTGGVITSAGLVLAATFAVLATIPLSFLAQIGITVALGVVLDTMVVRSILVTALCLDLGDRIWWPARLSRSRSAREG